jgi:hypothetical protein
VILPREALWLGELLHELLAFPNARHDDQIDSVSQFLNWAETDHRWRPIMIGAGPKFFVGGKEWFPGDP